MHKEKRIKQIKTINIWGVWVKGIWEFLLLLISFL